MIQFLIDEDVTPMLRDVANARGYNAYHVQYLDWKGRKDFAIRRRMLEEDLRKLGYVNSAKRLEDLKMPPGNRLHPLTDDREGQHAIWINDQYRVCFRWTDAGPAEVEVTDYH